MPRREREADRPPQLRRARTSCCPTTRPRCCASPTTRRWREQIGNDIVTASGTTLLGADNKAGVAEIVAAAEYLVQHPEIPHGADPHRLHARRGGRPRHAALRRARSSAPSAPTRWTARRWASSRCETLLRRRDDRHLPGLQHPPRLRQGARWSTRSRSPPTSSTRLPKDRLSPETTERPRGLRPPLRGRRRGRAHLGQVPRSATSSRAGLKEKEAFLEKLAQDDGRRLAGRLGRRARSRSATATCARCSTSTRRWSRTRARRSGAPASTLRERPIRGGTDGSRLSFMGLPTPNLFAGEHNFHSRLEWVSVQDMEKAVEVIVNLAQGLGGAGGRRCLNPTVRAWAGRHGAPGPARSWRRWRDASRVGPGWPARFSK